jgi:hypothetical protein
MKLQQDGFTTFFKKKVLVSPKKILSDRLDYYYASLNCFVLNFNLSSVVSVFYLKYAPSLFFIKFRTSDLTVLKSN